MPRFPSQEEIAAMKQRMQAKPSPDLVGPQVSVADMNKLRNIRPRNIMNEPIRQPKRSLGVGLTDYPFDDRMLKDRSPAEPESEQVDPDVRANVDAMIRIGAGMLAYENEKTFHGNSNQREQGGYTEIKLTLNQSFTRDKEGHC